MKMVKEKKAATTKKTTTEKTSLLSLPLLTSSGEEKGQIELPKEIFGQKDNPTLLAQVLRVSLSREKIPTATVKTRAQVSGGGKKPWRQKGTGRARVGSSRVPQWKGGGVVFGPNNEKRDLRLPEKMRKKALAIALSNIFKANGLAIFEKFAFEKPKTKKAQELLSKTNLKNKRKILLVLESESQTAEKSFRNIADLRIVRAVDLNTLSVVKSSGLVFTVSGLESLKSRFLKSP